MNIKDLLNAAKTVCANTGVKNYLKYLNPYTPARYFADKGKHEYGALYFMSWYALAGYLIARPKKKTEEKTEEVVATAEH